jgi:hypothetical protein
MTVIKELGFSPNFNKTSMMLVWGVSQEGCQAQKIFLRDEIVKQKGLDSGFLERNIQPFAIAFKVWQ